MYRILRILIIAAIALFLTAPAWAGESEEVQQVRNVIHKEWEAWYKTGDPEQIVSCYAPGFVRYSAAGGRGPEFWTVGTVGLDSLRTQYAARAVNSLATWAKHPNWRHGDEVLHVHIKDNHAIALTQQWFAMPDSTARQTVINEHQSVWMLKKIKEEWKITSGIGMVTQRQTVWKWQPE